MQAEKTNQYEEICLKMKITGTWHLDYSDNADSLPYFFLMSGNNTRKFLSSIYLKKILIAFLTANLVDLNTLFSSSKINEQ